MISAYLFDLDGTLIETESLWTTAVHQWILRQGKDIDYATVNAWVLGRAWPSICDTIFDRWPDLTCDTRELANTTRELYFLARADTDIRIPSSVALLRTLSRTTPCAIVSGSTRADIAEAIDIMDIADCLRFYLGCEDYARGKPDPSCFLLAAKQLNVPPETCVVFEDSAAGILAARRAAMRVVALARPASIPQDTTAAHLVLPDLAGFSPDAPELAQF